MRILLAIHNAYTDHTSGAAHSVRILMQWFVQAGVVCRVLATARFDAEPPNDLDAHLAELDVPLHRQPPSKTFIRSVRKPANIRVGRPTVDFTLNGVPVTMLMTRHNDATRPDRLESEQFLFLLEALMREIAPDVLLTYGPHPVVQEAMRRARRRKVVTVFTLRNRGYEDRGWFEHVDHAFTNGPFLSAHYRRTIGLISEGLESPIDWEETLAPEEMRKFVTFVNPSLAKGALVFARLADMLGARRPDIPLLVVQSAASAARLNAIPGLDFGRYPHIMAAPPTRYPADFFALTRILLVPSVGMETFGRVAPEAMINGIPPLVSDRGALPETVGAGGRVIPLPAWMTETTEQLPSVQEVELWFGAVRELWDDPRQYAEAAARARQEAEQRYAEPVQRQRYLRYFEFMEPGRPLFDDAKT